MEKILETKANTIKNIYRLTIGTALVLLIPLVAMQFRDDVNWGLADFIIIGALLMGTGLIYELVVKRVQNSGTRIILGLVILAAMILIWADLAVGIFNTPFSGN